MIVRFHDPIEGGFWTTPAETGQLPARLKEDQDGAEPAGNSVATLALLRLSAITDRPEWRQLAEASLRAHQTLLHRFPEAFGMLIQALDFSLQAPGRIAISGSTSDPRTQALIETAHQIYWPNRIICRSRESSDTSPSPDPIATKQPAAQVCQGNTCQAPVDTPGELVALLRRLSSNYTAGLPGATA